MEEKAIQDIGGADLSGANLDGANLSEAFLLFVDIQNTKFGKFGKLSLYKITTDKKFEKECPREIQEGYRDTWFIVGSDEVVREGKRIIRSIKFPPEFCEAGVSVLSYFGTIIRQEFPGLDVGVTIKQEGLKVTMEIQTLKGK